MASDCQPDERIFSSIAVWDTCYKSAEEAMAAAFSASKAIQGKTREDFISDYVNNLSGS